MVKGFFGPIGNLFCGENKLHVLALSYFFNSTFRRICLNKCHKNLYIFNIRHSKGGITKFPDEMPRTYIKITPKITLPLKIIDKLYFPILKTLQSILHIAHVMLEICVHSTLVLQTSRHGMTRSADYRIHKMKSAAPRIQLKL